MYESKYTDTITVQRILQLYNELKKEFAGWNKERLENYNAVVGKLLTDAEKAELDKDGRPMFDFNTLKPLITQIAGNYKNNLVSVEALPQTPDDIDKAEIMTKVIQFVLHQENDMDFHSTASYIDAIISRIGWLAQDWTWKDGKARIEIKRYDPFRLMFDTKMRNRDLSDCRYIVDSGWYNLDEIKGIYAANDYELYNILDEHAKDLFGKDLKSGKVTNWYDSIVGLVQKYVYGNKTINAKDSEDENNSSGVNLTRQLLQVIELHERRQELIFTIRDGITGESYDVTDQVTTNGKFDSGKMTTIKAKFNNPYILQSTRSRIYVTTIIPAFNIKIYEAPYPIDVPGFNFKFTPVFAYDYHPDILQMKSIIDDLKDPARTYTKHQNQMQEMLARMKKGQVFLEKSAAGPNNEYLEGIKSNKTGGIIIVEDGTIAQHRFHEVNSSMNLNAFQGMAAEILEFMKHNSGVTDNAMGSRENANESGTLFNQRVAQSDIMQEYVSENAQFSFFCVAKKLVYYIQKYMTQEQILRISTDEGDIKFITINQKTISGIINDVTVGEYDLIFSKSPYGRAGKDNAFAKLMQLVEMVSKQMPEFLIANLPTIIKASGSPYSKELIEKFNNIIQTQQSQQQPNQVDPTLQAKAQIEAMKGNVELRKADMDLQKANIDLMKTKLRAWSDIKKTNTQMNKLEQPVYDTQKYSNFLRGTHDRVTI